MDEMNIQEKAYAELIDSLYMLLDENKKTDFNGSDDYENGFLDGERELIKTLIMKMQKEIIGWHY